LYCTAIAPFARPPLSFGTQWVVLCDPLLLVSKGAITIFFLSPLQYCFFFALHPLSLEAMVRRVHRFCDMKMKTRRMKPSYQD
jgi:hypothetical protein